MLAAAIEQLLQEPKLWRGRRPQHRTPAIATGHAALDAALPGHGWPRAAVVEILHRRPGCGELSLLLPVLCKLGQRQEIAWVCPPYQPYPPALAQAGIQLSHVFVVHTTTIEDGLWAAEQILRSGVCAAVLLWLGRLGDRALRRLQLAAAAGDVLAFVFRDVSDARSFSPAALRLMIEYKPAGVSFQVLKARGGHVSASFSIRRAMTHSLSIDQL